ncbi:hypothetical protein AGMMS49941_04040 [Deferribacterales bacterium]|nr:hypothetical protein AGMMS49941_04040 [Deferribacterales bacterium]
MKVHKIRAVIRKILGAINTLIEWSHIQIVLVNHSRNTQTKLFRYGLGSWDSIRLATLNYLCHEIKRNKIAGAVAELGVFRGNFAKYINRALSDRELYLFDTFAGFDKKQLERDMKSVQGIVPHDFFGDTSIELVMKKMVHPELVRVVKGVFPASTHGIDGGGGGGKGFPLFH